MRCEGGEYGFSLAEGGAGFDEDFVGRFSADEKLTTDASLALLLLLFVSLLT